MITIWLIKKKIGREIDFLDRKYSVDFKHEKGEKQTDLDSSVMGKWAVMSLNNDQDQEKKNQGFHSVWKITKKVLNKTKIRGWSTTIYEVEKKYNFISIFMTLLGWVTFMGLIEIILRVVRNYEKRVIKSSQSRKCHFRDSTFLPE